MILIGELINATRKVIKEAISGQDADAIKKIALDQSEAGAHYIDANAGMFMDKEPGYLAWLVKTIQSVVDGPVAIDSPDPTAIEAALKVHQGIPMINSISLEKKRYDGLIPLIAGTDMKIIALCVSDDGMPETMDDRLKIADKLVNGLVQNNVKLDNIFVDPLVQPLSVNKDYGREFVDTVEQVMNSFKGIHTACGLSNISYGMPLRPFVNQTFMVMAILKGLDGVICNPLDTKMMATIFAAEALSGRDNFCMNFLKAFRAGRLDA